MELLSEAEELLLEDMGMVVDMAEDMVEDTEDMEVGEAMEEGVMTGEGVMVEEADTGEGC